MKCKIETYWKFFPLVCLYILIFGYEQIVIAELKIYYMRGPLFEPSELWVMNADGSNKKLFMKPPIPGSWMVAPKISPDGKRILFRSAFGKGAPEKLMVMNFDGSNLREFLADPPKNAGNYVGLWSLDGKRVVYSFSIPQPPLKYEIFVADAQGKDSFPIASDLENHNKFNPTWFPDSKRIAFAAMSKVPATLHVVDAVPNARAEPINIQLWASERIVWSLDGKRSIVEGRTKEDAQKGNELFLGDEGGNLIRLTNNNNDEGGAAWLPDGRHIVYTTDSKPPKDVAVMDVETKEVRNLTKDGQSVFAFWYDDSIVFSVNPSGKLSTSLGTIKTQLLGDQNR